MNNSRKGEVSADLIGDLGRYGEGGFSTTCMRKRPPRPHISVNGDEYVSTYLYIFLLTSSLGGLVSAKPFIQACVIWLY